MWERTIYLYTSILPFNLFLFSSLIYIIYIILIWTLLKCPDSRPILGHLYGLVHHYSVFCALIPILAQILSTHEINAKSKMTPRSKSFRITIRRLKNIFKFIVNWKQHLNYFWNRGWLDISSWWNVWLEICRFVHGLLNFYISLGIYIAVEKTGLKEYKWKSNK